MKRNVAGQKIGAQMVSATDGSEFTGAVTIYVTGDAGTQAVGSVGSGACAHEGHGYHSYAPALAETGYDLIAFTFVGIGAVSVTVQIETGFPQTGDAYPLLDTEVAALTTNLATANAALVTIAGYLDTEVAAIITTLATIDGRIDTEIGTLLTNLATANAALVTINGLLDTEVTDIRNRLPAALIGGRMDTSVGAMAANVMTAAATAADFVSEIAGASGGLDPVALRAAFGLADANLDDQLAALPAATGAVVEDAIFVTPRAQPAVRPDEDAPLGDDIKYLAAAKMNENVSTPTAWTLKDHAGTGTIATAPVTRVGTTVTKGRDT